MDLGGDQVAEIVMAGDLAGNLWRFNLASQNPSEWKVEHFFKTYTDAADVGKLPISVMPVVMRSGTSLTPNPIWIFGTGKFLGASDAQIANYPTQYLFGVRDKASAEITGTFPLSPATLTRQTISDSGGFRSVTSNTLGDDSDGWKIALDQQPGERTVIIPYPLYMPNLVAISTLIPGQGNPCEVMREGEFMILDAASGGASSLVTVEGASGSVGQQVVGRRISNPPRRIQAAVQIGGGSISFPQLGVGTTAGGASDDGDITVKSPNWQRKAWRELLQPYELDGATP
jgi:type IV pilus assembly protein PilY1